MAISTYSELQTAVAGWLDRTDLTTKLPDFVSLAEVDIRTDLRCQAMEQYTSGTLTGETLAHPTRYLEARRLTVGGVNYRYVTPEVYAAAVDANSTQTLFTAIGQTFYILGGTNGDAYTLIYYAAFEPFSADGDTNWLLTNYPNVYLWGACRQGGVYLEDDAKIGKFTNLYQDALGRLTARERQSAISGGPLSMRTTVTE
jgi:hypothetical protein